MKQFDNIIIGFGKGGKTLAATLAKSGQSVALIERSEKMYGGTCINVACIPSKSLEHSARVSAEKGGSLSDKKERYTKAIADKRNLTSMLNKKNYDKAVSAGVTVLNATASFLDEHRIICALSSGGKEELYGERIFINTGSRPFLPPIEGLENNKFVYTSETLMELDELPERLIIIGGGYIGLEFASYYTNFGSKVTIIQDGEAFIPREDKEIAAAVLENLESRGIAVLRSAKTQYIKEEADHAAVTVETKDGVQTLTANAVLIATGRRPNLADLNPQAAGIELTSRGAVAVNEQLRTNIPHIFAMGDVTGGLQFTYISLDDSRIVKSALLGDGSRTTKNRGSVPYTVFLDPPLSRVGLSEEEAVSQGYEVKIARLNVAAIPRAHVVKHPAGMLKAIVDAKTGMVLGAHFFCTESPEIINIIKLVMDASLPYTVLRDGIFNHPTMSEALNDLFQI